MSEYWADYLARGWSIIRVFGIRPDGQCECGAPDRCAGAGKHPNGSWRKYQTRYVPEKLAHAWFRDDVGNIGIVCGEISNLVVIDEDRPGAADHLHLPRTLTATTHHGRRHFYFQHPGTPIPTSIRFAPDVDLKGDGGFVVAPPSRHASGENYTWVDYSVPLAPLPQAILDRLNSADLPEQPPRGVSLDTWEEDVPQGQRDATLTRLAGSMFGRGKTRGEVLEKLRDHNQTHVIPPLPDEDIVKIVDSIGQLEERNKQVKAEIGDLVSQFREGIAPDDCDPKAYYGLAGECIDKIDPYLEPRKIVVLAGLLTAFGNKVGRGPYTITGPQRHHTNIFTLIFGDSGVSRKGMAWSSVIELLTPPEKERTSAGRMVVDLSQGQAVGWRPVSGIASGEGMIFHVRDATPGIGKQAPDPGVDDKRKLFYESEFGTVIRKAKPESSILWQTIRNFFDTGTAENNPRHDPVRATDAHISIIGNITPQELHESFPSAERTSGSANRFLWVFAPPGRCLPDGNPVPPGILDPLRRRLEEAVEFGKTVGLMTRDQEATEFWRALRLGELERDRIGPLSGFTSRGDALTLRLSMIYALLDKSTIIKKPHIEAALAIWRYSKASIQYLYGTSAGSPLGNKILNFLESCKSHSAKRSDVNRGVPGYAPKDLDVAIDQLKTNGLIVETRGDGTSGRPGPKPIYYRLVT